MIGKLMAVLLLLLELISSISATPIDYSKLPTNFSDTTKGYEITFTDTNDQYNGAYVDNLGCFQAVLSYGDSIEVRIEDEPYEYTDVNITDIKIDGHDGKLYTYTDGSGYAAQYELNGKYVQIDSPEARIYDFSGHPRDVKRFFMDFLKSLHVRKV